MMNALLVALGGGLGALCRYAVSALSAKSPAHGFAWGTTAVNLVGCLLIGFAAGALERSMIPRLAWLLLVTGFLGGFTTFSTFSLETMELFRNGAAVRAIAFSGLQVVGGLLATAGGLALALRLFRAAPA